MGWPWKALVAAMAAAVVTGMPVWYYAIPVVEKSLYWIEGTERRFDGYNFFGVHAEIPIEWFDKHID
jgi:hypothetical protein